MRFLLLIMLLAGPHLCAEQKTDKKPDASAETEEETVLTPFGRVKKQDPAPKPEPRPGAAAAMVDVEIVDGVATFKRRTPFGIQTWKRPVDELSPAEKTLLEESREADKPASRPADKPKLAPQEKITPEPR